MPSVTDVAAQYPELTLVSALIERAELSDIFLCPGPFTALLPTNAAFDAVDPVFLEFLLRPENQEALEDVLLYHILPGAIRTNELQSGTLETLLPGEVITVENFPVMFNDAAVETADIEACNGIIDTIDSVLLPFAPRKFGHSTVAAWNLETSSNALTLSHRCFYVSSDCCPGFVAHRCNSRSISCEGRNERAYFIL